MMRTVKAIIAEDAFLALRRGVAQGSGNIDFRCNLVNEPIGQWRPECAATDIVIVDPGQLEEELSEFLRVLYGVQPSIRVLIYAEQIDENELGAIINLGIAGFILHSCAIFCLSTALATVLEGDVPLSPQVSRLVLQSYSGGSVAESLAILTNRERQIFECLEQGISYKGIGGKFNISPHTVHTHVKNIYSKLQAVDKHDALMKARSMAWGC